MFFACFYGGFVPTVMSIVLIYGGFVPTVMSIFFLWRPRADCLLGADCLATLSRTTTDGFHLAMYFKPSNTRRPLPWPSCAPFFLPKKALYAGQSLQCKDRMAGLLRENDETNPSPWRFHLLACGTRDARIASCIFFGCIHFAATNKVHVLGRQARSLRAINSEEIPAQSENTRSFPEGAILGARLSLRSFTKAHKASTCFSSFCFVRIFRMFFFAPLARKGIAV